MLGGLIKVNKAESTHGNRGGLERLMATSSAPYRARFSVLWCAEAGVVRGTVSGAGAELIIIFKKRTVVKKREREEQTHGSGGDDAAVWLSFLPFYHQTFIPCSACPWSGAPCLCGCGGRSEKESNKRNQCAPGFR